MTAPAPTLPEPLRAPCPVCGNAAGNTVLVGREMMFGTRERFRYGACAACGLLWLLDVPADLSPYYPADYYSFGAAERPGALKRSLRRVWARHHLGRPTALGALLTRAYGAAPFFGWVRNAGATFTSRILDVGSGEGRLLREMRSCGFTDLTGADPFVGAERTDGGVRILKKAPGEIDGAYDLVMCHHAFEHMPDPAGNLLAMRRLVAPGGTLLVRIPVADSWARRHYGADWVALDPPRHLYIHTQRSIELLAAGAGLEIARAERDAGAMSLWASEQYRLDIPLNDARSYRVNPSAAPFTAGQIAGFEARARELNAAGEGDTAAFYLRPVA